MSIKIGIVDDNPTVLKAVRVFIESNTEWQVCGEVENGEDAIALAQRENPNALILDLLMPKMNGLDAARKISAISTKTEVVLFTCYAGEHLLREAPSLGVRSVVSKDETGALASASACCIKRSDRRFLCGLRSGPVFDSIQERTVLVARVRHFLAGVRLTRVSSYSLRGHPKAANEGHLKTGQRE